MPLSLELSLLRQTGGEAQRAANRTPGISAPMRHQRCSGKKPVAGCRVATDEGGWPLWEGAASSAAMTQSGTAARGPEGGIAMKTWWQRGVMHRMSRQQRKGDRLEEGS